MKVFIFLCLFEFYELPCWWVLSCNVAFLSAVNLAYNAARPPLCPLHGLGIWFDFVSSALCLQSVQNIPDSYLNSNSLLVNFFCFFYWFTILSVFHFYLFFFFTLSGFFNMFNLQSAFNNLFVRYCCLAVAIYPIPRLFPLFLVSQKYFIVLPAYCFVCSDFLFYEWEENHSKKYKKMEILKNLLVIFLIFVYFFQFVFWIFCITWSHCLQKCFYLIFIKNREKAKKMLFTPLFFFKFILKQLNYCKFNLNLKKSLSSEVVKMCRLMF